MQEHLVYNNRLTRQVPRYLRVVTCNQRDDTILYDSLRGSDREYKRKGKLLIEVAFGIVETLTSFSARTVRFRPFETFVPFDECNRMQR